MNKIPRVDLIMVYFFVLLVSLVCFSPLVTSRHVPPSLAPNLTVKVTDEKWQPIQGAIGVIGGKEYLTNDKGLMFIYVNMERDELLKVSASGYTEQDLEAIADGDMLQATLEKIE